MASSSIQSRNQKQKNGKRTMKLTEWYPEWERDVEFRNRGLRTPIERLFPELISMILMKLDPVDILYNAQLVCSSWYEICKDPFLWKRIDIVQILRRILAYNYKYNCKYGYHIFDEISILDNITKHMIDRSSGMLIDVNIDIEYYVDDYLVRYIADRSPQLTRLRLAHCSFPASDEELIEAVSKLPLLTDIDLSDCRFSENAIEAIGRCCPLLKSFKFNWRKVVRYESDNEDDWYFDHEGSLHFDKEALAIAANMPGLRHLMLLGNRLSNFGLQVILDGCSHLLSLDLRRCSYINLDGDLGKRCRKQIRELRGPSDHYDFECYSLYGGRIPNSWDGSFPDEDYDNDLLDDDDDDDDDDTDDDEDDFSLVSSHYGGYLHDEYDEIVNSRRFIEICLLLL